MSTYTVTPLGAAYLEALPDESLAEKIDRDFKRSKDCPTSKMFPTLESVEAFYAENGEKVHAVHGGNS